MYILTTICCGCLVAKILFNGVFDISCICVRFFKNAPPPRNVWWHTGIRVYKFPLTVCRRQVEKVRIYELVRQPEGGLQSDKGGGLLVPQIVLK